MDKTSTLCLPDGLLDRTFADPEAEFESVQVADSAMSTFVAATVKAFDRSVPRRINVTVLPSTTRTPRGELHRRIDQAFQALITVRGLLLLAIIALVATIATLWAGETILSLAFGFFAVMHTTMAYVRRLYDTEEA